MPVHKGNGVADNGGMVRVDVFFVEGEGYYLVPIYVADTKKAELPNRAIVANKQYEEWKEMRNEDFVTSVLWLRLIPPMLSVIHIGSPPNSSLYYGVRR